MNAARSHPSWTRVLGLCGGYFAKTTNREGHMNWTCPKCGKTVKATGKGGHKTFCGRDYTPIFWSRVVKSDGCWLWQGCKTYGGYGLIGATKTTKDDHNRKLLAHRYSWELVNGPVPDGYHVLHTCDTPACVRPDHLWVGTPAQNAADRIAKGRKGSRYQPVHTLLHPQLSHRGKMGKATQ